jgi:putative addiction module killer protein
VVEILEYLDQGGRSPFGHWFDALDAKAAAKINTARTRLSLGNWSNVKGVGSGVYERVIDFGPGYRIYFGKDGDKVVILLAGGTKKGQQSDIEIAIERWQDYKQRKKSEEK